MMPQPFFKEYEKVLSVRYNKGIFATDIREKWWTKFTWGLYVLGKASKQTTKKIPTQLPPPLLLQLIWIEWIHYFVLSYQDAHFWHYARVDMFFILLEIFQYVHGHLLLLQCKSASCLSSLYFSRVSKWNQAAASPALLPFKFFLLCFCVACAASQWSFFPWIIAPSPNTWHSAKLSTECCTCDTTPGRDTD